MNYLRNNLDNSTILCYDIMFEIYQYADPMYHAFEIIKNKKYDLDSIMYKRILKHMNIILSPYRSYLLGCYDEEHYYIDRDNFKDEKFKHLMIYGNHGYKDLFFMDLRRIPYTICGLDTREPHFNKYRMIWDLQECHPDDTDFERLIFTLQYKEIFAMWKQL